MLVKHKNNFRALTLTLNLTLTLTLTISLTLTSYVCARE